MHEDGLLNVYYDGGKLVAIWRRDGKVAIDRHSIDRCFFLRNADTPATLLREMRERSTELGSRVRGFRSEGDYLRVSWRWDVRSYEIVEWLKQIHARGIQTYEGTVPPHRRWMVENEVRIARPRRVYLDIETDARQTFDDALSGHSAVLCFAIVDEMGRGATAVLERDDEASELQLLRKLWSWIGKFDQVVSWSGKGFDFPVVCARAEQLGLDIESTKRRLLWVDHLIVFQKANVSAASSGAEKQSLKLNDIASGIGLAGKHDFDASRTWEAWSTAPCESGNCLACRRCLVRYCLQDTRLMLEIERKTGYLELLQTICETMGVVSDTGKFSSERQKFGVTLGEGAAGPNARTESLMLRIARSRGYRFPTRFPQKGEKYAGAYVMPPTTKGILRDVHVADFSGLYPNIIITWNMSQETKVARDDNGIARPDNCSEAAFTGVWFDTEKDGILPHAVAEMIRLRAHSKEMKSKFAPGTEEWKSWDRKSSAYKIGANGIYGVTGLPVSRLFDREVAESTTQCGAWLIQETMKAAELHGMKPVYGDTDSLFILGVLRDEFEKFVDWCNVDLYPRLLREKGCRKNAITLAYEKQFDRLVFKSAKCYAGSFVHSDGKMATAESKPEIKGLEFKRGDATKLARDFQEEVVYLVVGYKCTATEDPMDLVEVVERWRDRILNDDFELRDIMKSKTLKNPIDQYGIDKKTGKRKLRKSDGKPVSRGDHVEIAVILKERGREIRPGVRIDYVCVDGSCSPKKMIPAEDYSGEFDRHAMWENFVWPPTFRFLEAAFPDHDWKVYNKTRPPKKKRRRKDVIPGSRA